MIQTSSMWVSILLLGAPAFPQAQADWKEVRFHRVHLMNGNFIDGQLVTQTPKLVTLELKVGSISIRMDQIARDKQGEPRIEFVKVRTVGEPPKPAPKPPEPGGKQVLPFPGGTGATPPPPGPTPGVTFQPTGTTKEKVDQILEEVRKADSERKWTVARMLPEAGPGWAPYLTSILEKMEDATRSMALSALTTAKDPEAKPLALKLLESKIPGVRSGVARLLGEYEDPGIAGSLHPLLKDPDAVVKSAVLSALQGLKNPDSFAFVSPLMSDSEASVRDQAIRAVLVLTEDKDKILAAFRDGLDRLQGDARQDLIQALPRAGVKESWQTLAPYLREDSAAIRSAAAQALGQLGAPESVDTLVERMEGEREGTVRVYMAGAARAMKVMKAVDPLITWMTEPGATINIKAVCSRALKEITGVTFGPDPEAWSKWWAQNKPK